MAGAGPVPHAAMVLADLGASVLRVSRPASSGGAQEGTHVLRGRRSLELDLKATDDRADFLDVVRHADVLLEGFRPGVMERLDLGPDVCREINQRLIYARMTGWGQDGPLAMKAGHDINYLAVSGVLDTIGPEEQPIPPLSLVGDYGGGSMQLIVGILAALYDRNDSGEGQVLDVSMLDGICVLAQSVLGLRARGLWTDGRAGNMLDGGAPYYRTYRCSDGRFVAVGAIEPQFWRSFVDGLGLNPDDLPSPDDTSAWPHLSTVIDAVLRTRSRDAWIDHFADRDACVTPVLTFEEAVESPQVVARISLFRGTAGVEATADAPRFSRRPPGRRYGTSDSPVRLDDAIEAWQR
nr:alpha-methylacyl-CoA racemase [Rhodococcus wratislaviensis]